MTNTHTLGNFENALEDLRNSILKMASLTKQNFINAMKGLMERDTVLCNQAIADDDTINQLELLIDQEGMEIMMRYQPVASDLRRVITTMKISTDLERVSDQAVSIARRAKKLNQVPEIPETKLVEPLYEKVLSLFEQSLQAFTQSDLKLALGVKEKDVVIDEAHNQLIKDFIKKLEADTSKANQIVHLMFIVRFLERIGDHAKNIAEDTVYTESAKDIRHGGLNPEKLPEELLQENSEKSV